MNFLIVFQIRFFSLVTNILVDIYLTKYFYIKLWQFPNYSNYNLLYVRVCVYIYTHIVFQSYISQQNSIQVFLSWLICKYHNSHVPIFTNFPTSSWRWLVSSNEKYLCLTHTHPPTHIPTAASSPLDWPCIWPCCFIILDNALEKKTV